MILTIIILLLMSVGFYSVGKEVGKEEQARLAAWDEAADVLAQINVHGGEVISLPHNNHFVIRIGSQRAAESDLLTACKVALRRHRAVVAADIEGVTP